MKLINAWTGTFPFDPSSRLLRRVLICNAVSSGAAGVLLLAAGGPVAAVMGIPAAAAFLQVIGAGLIVFALGVEWLATRQPLPVSGARLVIALDMLWVLGSAIAVVFFAHELTLAGEAGIVGVALIVLVWAAGQTAGLRRLAVPERAVA